jgi:hypothetical protein
MPIPKPKGGQEQCKAADKDYKFFPLLVSYILEARITWTLCSWGTASHNKDGDTIPTGSTANFGYCRPNLQWGTAKNHCNHFTILDSLRFRILVMDTLWLLYTQTSNLGPQLKALTRSVVLWVWISRIRRRTEGKVGSRLKISCFHSKKDAS